LTAAVVGAPRGAGKGFQFHINSSSMLLGEMIAAECLGPAETRVLLLLVADQLQISSP
jgi:hypothetical protein